MSASQIRRRLAAAVSMAVIAASSLGTAAPYAQASSKPDVVKGHKVKLSYSKSCSTKNGKLYVRVSKKTGKGAYLCSGKVSTDKYGMPMYFNFIVTKASRKGSSARINVLVQLSPAVTKKWKHDTMKLKPNAVGYQYTSSSAKYNYGYVYRWLNNLAAKNTSYIGQFLVTSTDNSSGRSTVFAEEFRLKAYYTSVS